MTMLARLRRGLFTTTNKRTKEVRDIPVIKAPLDHMRAMFGEMTIMYGVWTRLLLPTYSTTTAKWVGILLEPRSNTVSSLTPNSFKLVTTRDGRLGTMLAFSWANYPIVSKSM